MAPQQSDLAIAAEGIKDIGIHETAIVIENSVGENTKKSLPLQDSNGAAKTVGKAAFSIAETNPSKKQMSAARDWFAGTTSSSKTPAVQASSRNIPKEKSAVATTSAASSDTVTFSNAPSATSIGLPVPFNASSVRSMALPVPSSHGPVSPFSQRAQILNVLAEDSSGNFIFVPRYFS